MYPILSSFTSLCTLSTIISSLFTVTSNCLSSLFIVNTTEVPALPFILLAANVDSEYFTLSPSTFKIISPALSPLFSAG